MASDIQRCLAREVETLAIYEEPLRVPWQRARRQPTQPSPSGLELAGSRYARWLEVEAEQSRNRRQSLINSRDGREFLPKDVVQRSAALTERWEAALQETSNNTGRETAGLSKDEEDGVNANGATQPKSSLLDSGRRRLAVASAVTMATLAVVILALYLTLHQPMPPVYASLALDLGGQPTAVTAGIAERLANIDSALQSNVVAMRGQYPEAQRGYIEAQVHIKHVGQLWVDSAIFDEPLSMDLRTATRLKEIARVSGRWWQWWSWVGLDWPAWSYVLPATWAQQRAGLRMAALLQAHEEEKMQWAERARAAIGRGRQCLAAAEQEMLQAAMVWLPIEAKEVSTAEGAAVQAAWTRAHFVYTQLKEAEWQFEEDLVRQSSMLAAVWKEGVEGVEGVVEEQSKMAVVQKNKKQDQEEQDGKWKSKNNNLEKMRQELLSHNLPALHQWATDLHSAATCRLEADCDWV